MSPDFIDLQYSVLNFDINSVLNFDINRKSALRNPFFALKSVFLYNTMILKGSLLAMLADAGRLSQIESDIAWTPTQIEILREMGYDVSALSASVSYGNVF